MRIQQSLLLWHRAAVPLCIVVLCCLTAAGQNAPIRRGLDAERPNAYSLPQPRTAPVNMSVPQPSAGAPIVNSPSRGYYPLNQQGNQTGSQANVSNRQPSAIQPKPTGVTTTIPTAVTNENLNVAQPARPGDTGRDVLAAARRAENQGNTAEAKRLYDVALQRAPGDRLTLLSYARMMHRVGEFEASIELYTQLLGLNSNDAVAMNDLSLCYARHGNMQQALALLAGAVSIQPESKRYRNNIAKLLIEVNRTAEAFKHLEYAHGGAIAHFNLGSMLHQRGRDGEALNYLRAAVEMDPSLTPAISLLATLEQSVAVNRLPAADDIENTEATENTGNAKPVQVAAPLPKQPWEPGSVHLQNAEMSSDEPVSEDIEWAVGGEPMDEQVISAAPLPFESPIRRYTRPKADSIQSYLDRQAREF